MSTNDAGKGGSLDRLREMLKDVETISEEVQAFSGMGAQIQESRAVVKAYEARQEELERSAWREGVREMATRMLPLMPEINVNSWEENLGEPTEEQAESRSWLKPWRRPKNEPVKAKIRLYPLAYLDEYVYFVKDPDGKQPNWDVGRTSILAIDAMGRLWTKKTWMWQTKGANQVPLTGRVLDLVKTREEGVELANELAEAVRRKYGSWHSHYDPSLVVLGISVEGSGEIAPWDPKESCALKKEVYERIVEQIKGLFEEHKKWMQTQAGKISGVVEKSQSADLKQLAPVPQRLR